MKSINSLSGGKTSSYLAYHYPADYNLFSLVCIDDINSANKDKKLIQQVNDKLQKYCSNKPEFIATAEDDKTIKVILDLEQLIGQEIIWLRGDSFEIVNKKHGKTVPNMAMRYCTTDMKIKPIAEWVYNNIGKTECGDFQPVFSNIGIRYDEEHRAKIGNERKLNTKIVIGKRGSQNKWKNFHWGIANYPLVNNKIHHYQIRKFWETKHLIFPEDSNCVGCFWKDVQQLRKNWDNNNSKMQWFADQESNSKYNYKSNMTYEQIKRIGLQQDFFFGTGSGCQAGFCTD
jgi:hypothetical protein